MFEKTFHVGRPNIPDKGKILSRFSKVIDNEWLTNNGPMVQELENIQLSYSLETRSMYIIRVITEKEVETFKIITP